MQLSGKLQRLGGKVRSRACKNLVVDDYQAGWGFQAQVNEAGRDLSIAVAERKWSFHSDAFGAKADAHQLVEVCEVVDELIGIYDSVELMVCNNALCHRVIVGRGRIEQINGNQAVKCVTKNGRIERSGGLQWLSILYHFAYVRAANWNFL